jgi:hypothetical protein
VGPSDPTISKEEEELTHVIITPISGVELLAQDTTTDATSAHLTRENESAKALGINTRRKLRYSVRSLTGWSGIGFGR